MTSDGAGYAEKELLSKVAMGDQAAFATLFENWQHNLGGFIFSITKSNELAEEITLDVFLKIWMTREALTEVNNFKAYLFTVSRNAAISALRKIARERTRHSQWSKQPVTDDTDEKKEKETHLSLIEEAINQLTPQRKKIYLLSREQGMKYKEIAEHLGISRFTVNAHMQQAVDSIVQFVKSRLGNELLVIWVILEFF